MPATSSKNTTIIIDSRAGNRERAITGFDAFGGAGLDFVAGLRMGLAPNYHAVWNFGTPIFCRGGALVDLFFSWKI
jgi:hypothetical protein